MATKKDLTQATRILAATARGLRTELGDALVAYAMIQEKSLESFIVPAKAIQLYQDLYEVLQLAQWAATAVTKMDKAGVASVPADPIEARRVAAIDVNIEAFSPTETVT